MSSSFLVTDRRVSCARRRTSISCWLMLSTSCFSSCSPSPRLEVPCFERVDASTWTRPHHRWTPTTAFSSHCSISLTGRSNPVMLTLRHLFPSNIGSHARCSDDRFCTCLVHFPWKQEAASFWIRECPSVDHPLRNESLEWFHLWRVRRCHTL